MTTLSTLSQARRRKPATYGKASRNANAWRLSPDTLDGHELPASATAIADGERSVKEVYQVQKEVAKPATSGFTKPSANKQDSWNVPSSDDEEAIPFKRKSQLKVLARQKVGNTAQSTRPQLAPWEEKKEAVATHSAKTTTRREQNDVSPEDQLMSDLTQSLKQRNTTPAALDRTHLPRTLVAEAADASSSPQFSSTAARLQARKLLSADGPLAVPPKALIPSQKRPGDASSKAEELPLKRARTDSHEDSHGMRFAMYDAPAIRCESVPRSIADPAKETDIYDLPSSGADESTHVKSKVSPRRPAKKRSRHARLIAFSSPPKVEYATARLNEMLPTDTDTTDSTAPSTSMTPSRPATPTLTSGVAKAATPETAFKRSASMTPRQAQLWDRILTNESLAPSPSALKMRELSLSTRRTTQANSSHSQPLPKSSHVRNVRRPKLVDRLKASTPTSEDDMSDQDESESSLENMDMDVGAYGQRSDEAATSQAQSQSQSQSQSQTPYNAKNGPKVTYARTRSYLPEDSLEDQLMLDLPGEESRTTASWGVATRPSGLQKSAFDLDESDDEDDHGRMRTAHELRAGGGTRRFLDSLGGLLEDISDHNSSARSRRRSALIELATKLAEKSFLDKFFRHGHEQQLVIECSAAPDDIADYVLAAIFVSLLVEEPPDHVIEVLKGGNVLSWLDRLVLNGLDPRKLAQDRRNNMSKSAQSSFVQFAESLGKQEKIWGDEVPLLLTPRTLSLKTYELLIRKLRSFGDRSELVESDTLRQLTPTETDLAGLRGGSIINVAASISALESLSTIALSLAWPTGVIEQLRDLLVSLPTSEVRTQDLRFLTLRLSLNVTNENARNCKIYSTQKTVSCMLRGVGEGFQKISENNGTDDEQRTINLDLLVLSLGVMTNLAQHSKSARRFSGTAEAGPVLRSVTDMFQQGQKQLLEAESVEQGANNVAYGYLAVMLADLCRDMHAKNIIASRLPGGNLHALVDAVEEFVRHHQSVDKLNFAGEEGGEVWGAFTEKLGTVLDRLKVEAQKLE